MLGCFNPNLGQIWTNPNVGLKMSFKILTQLQLSLSTVILLLTFLTQHLGLSTKAYANILSKSRSVGNMDEIQVCFMWI